MKKVFALMMSLAVLFVFAACGGGSGSSAASAASDAPAVITPEDGEANGKVGDTIELYWYDLIVRSATEVDSYAGYEPAEGNKLIDVVIYFESVFSDVSPMSNAEYSIHWGRGASQGTSSLDALDDTMMPSYWEIEPDEKIEYHLVFEVPADKDGFSLEFEASFESTPDEVTYFFVDLGL